MVIKHTGNLTYQICKFFFLYYYYNQNQNQSKCSEVAKLVAVERRLRGEEDVRVVSLRGEANGMQ